MIFKGKTILITGGTGSMGKTLVRRLLSGVEGNPSKVIVFSRDEAKQHYMRLDFLKRDSNTDDIMYHNFKNILEFRIGDVRSYSDVCSAIKNVDIVINAAALKQVPSCEYFPYQAMLTNCVGAQNLVQAIADSNSQVECVIGVSTDKACKPVNVMGMTKSLQERIFLSANILIPKTRFSCVRYGNVLASRGSVIPLFHHQIRNKGPVTITDKKMTRFLLSLEDAVDTVIAAIKWSSPGETYIPIVPAANMENVAKALIQDRDIKIEITGIRPGEKLHESLVSEEESFRTFRNHGFYVIKPILPELAERGSNSTRDLIGEYASNGDVLDLNGTYNLLQKNNLLIDQQIEEVEQKEMIK